MDIDRSNTTGSRPLQRPGTQQSTSRSIAPPTRSAAQPTSSAAPPTQAGSRRITPHSAAGAQPSRGQNTRQDQSELNADFASGASPRNTDSRSARNTNAPLGQPPQENSASPNKTAPPKKSLFTKIIFIVAIVFSLGVLTFAVIQIMGILNEDMASSSQYDELRNAYTFQTFVPEDGTSYVDLTAEMIAQNKAMSDELLAQNPDYWGWLNTSDGTVDYPVLQSADNSDYLTMGFDGEYNRLGAVFTDFRSPSIDDQHILIHGHNANNGTMFGSLDKYLEEGHLEKYPTITIVALDGTLRVYDIVSYEDTDTDNFVFTAESFDPTYFDEFKQNIGADAEATQILTLSTCTDEGSDSRRFMVHAQLRTSTQG